MSVEICENPKSIHDLGLVEGIFLNAMVCLLHRPTVKASQIGNGRLSEQLTRSAMKIQPNFVRDLALVLTEMERGTGEPQVLNPHGALGSPAKQSGIFISEKAWSFAKTLGIASCRLVGDRLHLGAPEQP